MKAVIIIGGLLAWRVVSLALGRLYQEDFPDMQGLRGFLLGLGLSVV